MRKFYIYIHKKPCGEIFYVGKGSGNRAYQTTFRNRYWNFIVGKHGYIVDIIENNLTSEEACEKEIALIKKLGRKDLNTGTLVNMTDGGDGNHNFSAESRKAISDKAKGRPSGKKGKPVSEELKKRISDTLKRKYKSGELVPNLTGLQNQEIKKGRPKGFTPWNKGLVGISLPSSTSFKKGNVPWNKKQKPVEAL